MSFNPEMPWIEERVVPRGFDEDKPELVEIALENMRLRGTCLIDQRDEQWILGFEFLNPDTGAPERIEGAGRWLYEAVAQILLEVGRFGGFHRIETTGVMATVVSSHQENG